MTETNALGTTTTTYDLDHDVTSIQDADRRVWDFVYDNDQRLTAENWMNGSTVIASMNDTSLSATIAGTADFADAYAYDGDQAHWKTGSVEVNVAICSNRAAAGRTFRGAAYNYPAPGFTREKNHDALCPFSIARRDDMHRRGR